MILRRTIICLGMSQLISWGISYYLIGVFGDLIVGDLGWSREVVYGGFSVALVVMGLSSPLIGTLIERKGGRTAMNVGALLNAGGCVAIALSHSLPLYFAGWVLLGLGMRLTLYDAAFAALARIGGPGARRPISQITLLGGLASTVFWPMGSYLAEVFGWRGALMGYAFFALLTLPLHLALPHASYGEGPHTPTVSLPLAAPGRQKLVAAGLYASIVALTNFLNSGMSAHMIPILTGLGLGATLAVSTASLRGIGQSLARLCEVLFGRSLSPLTLNVIATCVLPLSFLAGFFVGVHWFAAVIFAFFYGAANGLVTITRGSLPLVLFDHKTYGSFVGRLVAPSFLFSAAAPIIYAAIITRYGENGALALSAVLALATAAAAVTLQLRFGKLARAQNGHAKLDLSGRN